MHERWESSSQVAALGVRPTRYVALQRYCKRAIGKVVAVCAGAAREDPGPLAPRLARQLLDEPGLSDAGFAAHHDHAALALVGSREHLAQLTKHGITADKRYTLIGGRSVNRKRPCRFGLGG